MVAPRVLLSAPVTARGTAVVIGSPSVPIVIRVTPFGLSNKAVAPEVITEGVVTDVVALTVVNAPVFAVVAPTVPLMLMEAVPVRFVTTPDAGVPNAGVTRVGLVDNTMLPVPVTELLRVTPP